MLVQRFHHVAYRCMDSVATIAFYGRVLGMTLIGAAAEDRVPSTREPDPYLNIFLDAGDGDILAFFEVPRHRRCGRTRTPPPGSSISRFR